MPPWHLRCEEGVYAENFGRGGCILVKTLLPWYQIWCGLNCNTDSIAKRTLIQRLQYLVNKEKFWAAFKIVYREVHVPKSLTLKIFEPFLKSCTSEVRVPRGRVPRGLTVLNFAEDRSSDSFSIYYYSVKNKLDNFQNGYSNIEKK